MSFKINRKQKICKKFQMYEKNREQKRYIHSQLLKKLGRERKRKMVQNGAKPGSTVSEPDDHDYIRIQKNCRTRKKRQGGKCPPKQ